MTHGVHEEYRGQGVYHRCPNTIGHQTHFIMHCQLYGRNSLALNHKQSKKLSCCHVVASRHSPLACPSARGPSALRYLLIHPSVLPAGTRQCPEG